MSLKLREAQEICKRLRDWLIANLGEDNSGMAALRELEHNLFGLEQKARSWRIGYRKGQSRIPKDKEEAIRQWQSQPKPKETVAALARRLKVSRQTVYSVLQRKKA